MPSFSALVKHRKNRYKQFAPATPSRVTQGLIRHRGNYQASGSSLCHVLQSQILTCWPSLSRPFQVRTRPLELCRHCRVTTEVEHSSNFGDSAFEKEQRNQILLSLLDLGAGLRQLSRLTGVTYGVINKLNKRR